MRRAWWAIAVLVIAYAIVRILTLPEDVVHARGLGHDSAYLTIVARNLLAGKGFVLDALWLVPLLPDHLPMPYHNANPLYPVFIAITSRLTGLDVFRSGFLFSALTGVALLPALTWLFVHYIQNPWRAFAVATAVAAFPPIWMISWMDQTDGLWLLLMVAFIAALVRSESIAMSVLAGAMLGAAWLTRAATSSVLPGLAIWLLLTLGWRKATVRLVMIGLAATVISSPWLMHTAKVWGSPLRSDNGLLFASHLESRNFDGWTVRVWHRPVKPPPVGEVVKQHPFMVVNRILRGYVKVFRETVRGSAGVQGFTVWNVTSILLLASLSVIALIHDPGQYKTPTFIAILTYAATFTPVLAIAAPYYFESRYMILFYAVSVGWLMTTLSKVVVEFVRGQRDLLHVTVLGILVLYFVGLVPRSDCEIAAYLRSPDPYTLEYMQAAETLNSTIAHGAPVVVGFHPYFYALWTGSQALGIPESDDRYLLQFMKKYRAKYILLNDDELKFWRPAWISEAEPAPGIRLARSLGRYYVYEVIGVLAPE
jgi:hypothetical protein